jgi:hypothetical protein
MLKKTKKNEGGFEWCSRALVNAPLHIALCTSEAGYRRELRRLGQPNPPDWLPENSEGCVHEYAEALIVCVRPKKNREEVIATLVHESVHVWQHIRDYIGERSPSVEFEAYSVETIFSTLREAYDGQVSGKAGATAKRKQRKSA